VIFIILICTGCVRDGPLIVDMPITEISGVLDANVPVLMNKYNIEGLSVAIIRDSKLAITKSYGYSDIESGKKINSNTIYRAASLGKPVFSYLVVQLSLQGKIDLDRPLFSYFNKRVVENDPRSEIITTRMVLSHTTGLPNLNVKQKDVMFSFDPGHGYKYSGHAYIYLQKVVEKISGKTLNQLAEELVFQPLQMSDSSYRWKAEYDKHIATGYRKNGKKYPIRNGPSVGYSAWSLFTTPRDYSFFVAHIIETSKYPNSVASLLLESTVTVADRIQWGLGWGLQDTIPFQSFWHWGSNPGFRHYIVGYPQEKIAVIVMSNSDKAFKIADDVMVKAIGGSYPSYDWF